MNRQQSQNKQQTSIYSQNPSYKPPLNSSPQKEVRALASSMRISLTNEQAKSRFTPKELQLLEKRFNKLAKNKGTLTKDEFRESLGLMGLEHSTFLSERLFNVMDTSNDKSIDFKEYTQYLAIVLNGSDREKAQMSFNFLDINNHGKLLFRDFEKLVFDISIFWNMVTGGKIIPQKDRIQRIWNLFSPSSGELQFQQYYDQYENLSDIFDWFRFFNQDDNTMAEQLIQEQANLLYEVDHSHSVVRITVNTTLNLIEHRVHETMLQLKSYDSSKPYTTQSHLSNVSSNKLFTAFEAATRFHGPCFVNLPKTTHNGDQSPQHEHPRLSRMKSHQSNNFHKLLTEEKDESTSGEQRSLAKISQQLLELKEVVDSCLVSISQHETLQNKQQTKFESIKTKQEFNTGTQFESGKMRVDSLRRRQTIRSIVPKQGEVKHNISVYFGHENWNLILNMMIGMRKSIKCIPAYLGSFPQSDIEFTEKALHDILPQRSKNFDYRKVFHFIDYRPTVFYRIRLMYGVTNQDYQRSVGPETMLGDLVMGRLNSLSELGSSGKSGSFFYFTQDSKYMIKTISVLEAKFFKRILENYYQHLNKYPQTLISRIFGFHKMKMFKTKTEWQKVYLIVICNIFETGLEIDFRYDLKGWKVTLNIIHNRIFARETDPQRQLASQPYSGIERS